MVRAQQPGYDSVCEEEESNRRKFCLYLTSVGSSVAPGQTYSWNLKVGRAILGVSRLSGRQASQDPKLLFMI